MNNHICASRTCVFCKALDQHQRRDRKEPVVRARADEQAIKRAWEVSTASQLEATRNTLESTNLEEMESYVLLDKVTGIYNSRTLNRELAQEIQRAQRLKKPLALCMVAIDGLMEIARYQNSFSVDVVLRTIANTLKKNVREIDMPCRQAADKFAVILPETNISGAMVVAERIRRKITSELGAAHGITNKLTVSVAIAAYPLHARKQDELIDQATKALSYSMIQGGECIVQATIMH